MRILNDVNLLAETVRNGGVILYPTDTVWGLGCDATNAEAVQKIYELKNRPADKALIILVESEKRLQQLVDVPAMAWEIMDLSEKPVTIVYENCRALPAEVKAADGSVAIRLTKNTFCRQLISKINAPLVSTSANLSGQPAVVTLEQVNPILKNGVDAVAEPGMTEASGYEASSVIQVWMDGRIKVHRE